MVRQYEGELNRLVANVPTTRSPASMLLLPAGEPRGRRRSRCRELPRGPPGAEDAGGELLMVEVSGRRSALDALKRA